MAHRKGHFDSTTFRRMNDKFNEEQLKSSNADIVGGELNLPTFSFRGKDKYAKNLSEGAVVNNAFRKIERERGGKKPKYPYLTSRFLINSEIKDGIIRGERKGLNTIRDNERNLQQTQARRSLNAKPEILKEFEASAELSSQLGENLLEARQLGSEDALSKAIFDAQDQSRNNQRLSQIQRKPRRGEKFGDKFTGDFVDNVAFKNATMLDEYTNVFRDAVEAQDKSDYYKEYFGSRVNRPLVNNYFDTRGGE